MNSRTLNPEMVRAIDCATQHIKVFHEQSNNEQIANYGEPCKTCYFAKECSLDWISVMNPLLKQSIISISMVYTDKNIRRK